jgi:hypothetical protein
MKTGEAAQFHKRAEIPFQPRRAAPESAGTGAVILCVVSLLAAVFLPARFLACGGEDYCCGAREQAVFAERDGNNICVIVEKKNASWRLNHG